MGSGKVLSAQTGVGLPVSECDSMNSHSSEPCFGIKPQRSLMGKKKKSENILEMLAASCGSWLLDLLFYV